LFEQALAECESDEPEPIEPTCYDLAEKRFKDGMQICEANPNPFEKAICMQFYEELLKADHALCDC
jgi:hypothetical protein